MSYFKKSFLPVLLSFIITATPVFAGDIIYGDADQSGSLTANDCAVILLYSLTDVYLRPGEVAQLDVNKDGNVDAADAAMVLTKVLNADYRFPVDKVTTPSATEITTTPSATQVTTVATDSTKATTEATTKATGESTTENTTKATTEATTEGTTKATTEATTESTTKATTTTEATTETTTKATTTTEATTETTTIPQWAVKTGAGIFTLGQKEATLPTAYNVGTTPDGLKCYSYSGDYAHYTRVGVSNGQVVKIITFDTDVSYEGYSIGDKLNITVTDDQPDYVENCISNRRVKADLYYDRHAGNRVYAISLTQPSYLSTITDFTEETIDELNMQIVDMTNAYRVGQGLNEYFWNPALGSVAQEYAQEMAQSSRFSHTSADGKTHGDRISAKNIKCSKSAENINAGYYDAESAINGWINSAGHRKNLVSPDYTHIGVGSAYNPNDTMQYYTRMVQNFIKT